MILQALAQHYEDLVQRGDIAQPGWARAKVSYALGINAQGELERVIPLLEDKGGKKPVPRQFDLPAPVKRTSGIAANFLWDNSGYLLGVDAKGKSERSVKYFAASRTLHHQLLDAVDDPAAKGLLAFFDHWDPITAAEHPALRENLADITAGANLVFRMDGTFLHENTAIRQAWQEHYDRCEGKKQQCLVTGLPDVIEPVHPSIKGVAGAQSSGAAIVSFNAPAFWSYGQEQSYNAPVGKHAAFAYTAALNHLLADRKNVQRIGDASVVCWAEGAEPQYQEFVYAALFGQEQADFSEDDLRDAVKKLAHGERVEKQNLDPKCPFYILGLSPNAARLSVRFFYRSTYGKLMENVNAYHEEVDIVRPSYDPYKTIPLWALLRETANPNARDKSPSPVVAGAAARAVFTGGPYPAALLEQTVLRIRAEHNITRGKAAIIKAYYQRKNRIQSKSNKTQSVISVLEGAMEKELNDACDYLPYLLGRLFAVMETVQTASVGGKENIKRTIKDSYFTSAASTPNAIFQKLFPLSEYHMKKLEREKPGFAYLLSQEKAEILGKIRQTIPSRFSPDESNTFYLGYYHQTQKRYQKKEDK